LLLLAGCVTDSQHNKAMSDIDAFWKGKNDNVVATEGRRIVQIPQRNAFIAVQKTAQRLGMIVESQDPATGYILASSMAPTPLTPDEWTIVQENDTEEMRQVVGETIGAASWFVDLDPSGKEVLANALVTETREGTEISLAIRLRSTRTEAGRDRRLQPPPTAMRIGMEKFWAIFEEEVGQKPTQAKLPAVAAPFGEQPPIATQPTKPNGVENPDAVAVIIGNRTYGGDIPDVAYAHNDADAMRKFVVDALGYREGNVIDLRDATLVDMQAILGNEKSHRGQLWRWVRPRESDVIVYYSGHGVPGTHDKRQYLLPVKADPNSPEIGGYALETLYGNLSKLEARSIRVYLDTCFSGESPGGPLLRSFSGLAIPAAPETALTVVTAASNEQLASWDEEAQLGLFTRYLLDGLQGAADDSRFGQRDGRVTLQEIKGYLDREMTYIARRRYGREQNVTARGNMQEVLARLPH
jgi:hypothetical protein